MTASFLLLIAALVCFIVAFLEYQWNKAIAAGLICLVASMLVR